jgi:hypothetical protein
MRSSIPDNDIPVKLRCAVCNRCAVNAFKLPCCDQAICENCTSTAVLCLPGSWLMMLRRPHQLAGPMSRLRPQPHLQRCREAEQDPPTYCASLSKECGAKAREGASCCLYFRHIRGPPYTPCSVNSYSCCAILRPADIRRADTYTEH